MPRAGAASGTRRAACEGTRRQLQRRSWPLAPPGLRVECAHEGRPRSPLPRMELRAAGPLGAHYALASTYSELSSRAQFSRYHGPPHQHVARGIGVYGVKPRLPSTSLNASETTAISLCRSRMHLPCRSVVPFCAAESRFSVTGVLYRTLAARAVE